MTALLDPKWQVTALAPLMRLLVGKGMATEQAAKTALDALMLPGDVYKGNVSMYGADGRTNPQVINRSADLAGMLTLGSGAIPADPNSLRMGIKAYHGSPYDFDRFDMSKIGTGEGAQAYGHGLYFADNEAVARSYRNALAPGETPIQGVTFRGQEIPIKNPETPLEYLITYMRQTGYDPEDGFARAKKTFTPEMMKEIEGLSPADFSTFVPDKYTGAGRMYEVNINADPNDFLDWDKPLSEQSAKVQGFASEYLNDLSEATGGDLLRVFGRNSTAVEKDAAAKGIPGVKYLDGGSRGAGDGSRNYVVFDDKLISIVKKYGVAALVSAGVLSQAQGEELKARGYY